MKSSNYLSVPLPRINVQASTYAERLYERRARRLSAQMDLRKHLTDMSLPNIHPLAQTQNFTPPEPISETHDIVPLKETKASISLSLRFMLAIAGLKT